MQRHYPLNPATGVEDATQLPWTNGVPSTGTEGSYPPFQLCVDPQEEILAVIFAADITPLESDLTQLLQAIRVLSASQPNALVHSGNDTSPTANQIVATVSPAITAYAEGLRYEIKLANALSGSGAVANICGLGNRTIVRADGAPTQQGDGVAGQMLDLIDDGTHLQIAGLRSSFIPASNYIEYATPGTYSFTVPAGITKIFVRVWGGGGGGGGCTNNASACAGGGGGYAEGYLSVTPGQVLTIIVGAGGYFGNGSPTSGGTGGTSSVGTAFSATGGGGGNGSGGGATAGNASGGTGSLSGSGLTVQGGSGGAGVFVGAYCGSAGGGSYSTSVSNSLGVNANAADGNFPGGGAEGAASSSGGGQNGGTGGDGLVILQY